MINLMTTQGVQFSEETMDSTQPRRATLVDWYAAPALVTVDQSSFLCGISTDAVHEIMDTGGVDLVEQDGDVLIDKASLREFWEIYWELRSDAGNDD